MSEGGEKIAEVKSCRFMLGIKECRQLGKGEENFEICRLCINGRIEAHLFDLKAYVGKLANRNRGPKNPQEKHWSDKDGS